MENKRYIVIKIRKMDFYSVASSMPFTHGQINQIIVKLFFSFLVTITTQIEEIATVASEYIPAV